MMNDIFETDIVKFQFYIAELATKYIINCKQKNNMEKSLVVLHIDDENFYISHSTRNYINSGTDFTLCTSLMYTGAFVLSTSFTKDLRFAAEYAVLLADISIAAYFVSKINFPFKMHNIMATFWEVLTSSSSLQCKTVSTSENNLRFNQIYLSWWNL